MEIGSFGAKDIMLIQQEEISLKEYIDPFTGEPAKKGK